MGVAVRADGQVEDALTRHPNDAPENDSEILGYDFQTQDQQEADFQEAEEKVEIRRQFLAGLMTDAMFREWLWEQLTALGAFNNAFGSSPVGFPDPLATHFQLGRKAAGWDLWEMFDNAAPEWTSLMRREAMKG